MKKDVETHVHYTARTPRISSSPELMRGWGKLHNECLPNLYFLGRIIRITSRTIRWVDMWQAPEIIEVHITF